MTSSVEVMIQYLLGELTEEERTALEKNYFSDGQEFNELSIVENELVDNYVRGKLPASQRRQFEQAYLNSPARRERVKFAEALVTMVDGAEISQPASLSLWQTLVAPVRMTRLAAGLSFAAFVLLVVASVWLLREFRRTQYLLAQEQATRSRFETREHQLQELIADEQKRANQLVEELSQVRSQQANQKSEVPDNNSSFVSLIISLASTRDADVGSPRNLVLRSLTKEVRLQIRMAENSYQRYLVQIQTASGKEIFRRKGLTARPTRNGASLNLIVPAASFDAGDYLMTVQGLTPNGESEDLSKSLINVQKQ